MNDAPEGLFAPGFALSSAPWLAEVERAVARGADALLRDQRPDGHWVFELEADATIPAEYVLLRHFLGEADDGIEARIARYLRRIQAEDGGWPLFHGGASDLSATVKAYFALKMVGDDPDAPHMARARALVLARGGAGSANVFTRILLALYEQLPWRGVPTVPVELILLPRSFPVHLSKMSYWARTVLVPLLVLMALPAKARNPRGIGIPELVLPGRLPRPSGEHQQPGWAALFAALDSALKVSAPLWPKGSRKRAIERCVAFVTERLNGEDGLGAIYPAMANTVMMFAALGYAPDHPHAAIARRAVEKLLVHRDDEAYCQPCVSPVWDTALVAHALMEVGGERAEAAARRGLDWLKPLQELDAVGDWAETRPNLRPGGWAFQYRNAHYPDLDDTAVVVMAMDRARRDGSSDYDEAIARGTEWTAGLQSTNGGWGAFDADNTHHYLNNIPFADHGALLDPPTADVTARCVGMLAQLGEAPDSPRLRAALDFLAREQEPDGSWFGRWGVNHVYGTWSVLCALNAAGLDGTSPPLERMIRRAADWLLSIQNDDGGWGEGCESYRLDRAAHDSFPSTASQTAWALLGLMAAGEADHPAVARGIEYLRATQDGDGFWPQDAYTGGGFPRVFYLRYHGYPRFFPLWAMARYRNLRRGNTARVGFGM